MRKLDELLKGKDFLDDDVLAQCEMLADEFQGVKPTQARKYFNDIKLLKRMAERKEVDWDFIKMKLRLLLAQLAYAEKRPGSPIKPRFRKFFETCLTKVIQGNDPEGVVKFAIFLEMVYAYYYAKYS